MKLALLAAPAEPKEFQGVEQQLEALGVLSMQMDVVHRAVLEHEGAAAVHAGEMVLIAIHGSKQGFAAGEMPAAHQAPLLQLAQVPVHRGEAHGLGALAQHAVQILTREFPVGAPQLFKQELLTFARGGNLG